MFPKKFRGFDNTGISVRDEYTLDPKLCKKKYQINIRLPTGKVRYLYLNEPSIAELYVKIIDAKILKIKKLHR